MASTVGRRGPGRRRAPSRPGAASGVDTLAPVTTPEAVLLDVGGVFLLPEHQRILGALDRAGCTTDADLLDGAHYRGASRLTTDLDVEGDWSGSWQAYLDRYVEECGVAQEDRTEVHRHLDSEFADAGLWLRVIPGCRQGIRALADTGVRLGVVSNADGLIGERLRMLEILQVGPGIGVEVECVIDSGEVGVMKPDRRIFTIALDALDITAEDAWYVGDMPGIDVVGARRAGLRPVLMDPLGLHHDADYDRVDSLTDLAHRIEAGASPR
jgi:putative hydrolase of the HAD superfamily